MTKKRVLHVITNFAGVGGAEMMLARLIQQTKDQVEHTVIALMQTSEVYQEALASCTASYALNWNGRNSIAVTRKLRYMIQQLAPDVVQCWMYHANVITSFATLGLSAKPRIFWGIHHSLASTKEESLSTKIALACSRMLAQKPDGIIYCAHSALVQHQAFGLNNPNAQVIANGVSLEKFQPNPNLNEPCVIGFAGRYHPAKGYDYLFAVIAKLKDQPIIFKIAGQGSTRDNPAIQAYFDQYQLDSSKVQLLGQVSNMPAFYHSIDAFLMTSITEGFPNVLVEAMASGLPCVSTDVGDAKYIVQEMGTVVAPRDVDALAHAILKYVELNTVEKQQLKHLARHRVEQNFALEHVCQQYLAMWSTGR